MEKEKIKLLGFKYIILLLTSMMFISMIETSKELGLAVNKLSEKPSITTFIMFILYLALFVFNVSVIIDGSNVYSDINKELKKLKKKNSL